MKVVSLFTLIAAIGIAYYWMSHKPTLHPKRTFKRTLKRVDFCPIEPQQVRFEKDLFFRIVPYEQLQIKPRVASKVIWINPKLYAFGVIKEGEPLFKLDRNDFLLELITAKSALAQAKLELEQEIRKAERAKVELALVKRKLSQSQKEFLLRKPFLEAARARVAAAQAEVKKAELSLQRCTITAPFSLQVKRLLTGVADVVSPSQPLAEAVRVDRVVGEVAIDPRLMAYIDDNVTLHYDGVRGSYLGRSSWVDEETQEGIVRFLFPQALPIGAYVQGTIRAKSIDGVVAIPKEAFGLDGGVWVIKDGRLHKRVLPCLWESGVMRYCKSGKLDLVTRIEPYFFEGMRVEGARRCD